MAIELKFSAELEKELGLQFDRCAELVANDNHNINHIIEQRREYLIKLFKKYYMIIATTFGNSALNHIRRKDAPFDYFKEYWISINKFITKYTAMKVQNVSNTTKKTISKIIRDGYNAGDLNRDIAKKISVVKEIQTKTRAKTIARTETHSMAVTSTDTMIHSTGLFKYKEWLSAIDDRTRVPNKYNFFDHEAANGEVVGIDEYFVNTGEPLRYPGDMDMGSPGNIINCRCTTIYLTQKSA